MNWNVIIEHIQIATGQPFQLRHTRAVAGGDINSAYCLHGADQAYFVKLNRADRIAMFMAEASGLSELAATKTVRIPFPVVHGIANGYAFLAMEYIEFGSDKKDSSRRLGQQLAQLHQIIQPYFGWHQDNTIGSTPQPNNQGNDWVEFWRTQRLTHQLSLAAKNGHRGSLYTGGEKLCTMLNVFFDDYQPQPALLHGDLWGGNTATDNQGNPVIFDPACYYGDREADIAMTELFGGFNPNFYAAYNDTYPLDSGFNIRKKLYNLYHILNHLNLFGSGYLRQAEHMISSLLSEIS